MEVEVYTPIEEEEMIVALFDIVIGAIVAPIVWVVDGLTKILEKRGRQ